MALVRRDALLGAAERVVAAALSEAPAVGRAVVPARPSAVDPGTAQPIDAIPVAGPLVAGSVPGAVATVATNGPAPVAGAAAAHTQPASLGAIVMSFVLVAAGGAGSWALWRNGLTPTAIRLQDNTTVFAALFAFATAVERILEPFARFLPGKNTKAVLEQAIADLANRSDGGTDAHLNAVAVAKATLEKARSSRTLITWGIATAVATVGSSAGGFYLLHAIAGPQWNGIAVWVDAIVTGLVVGSGTKPLHDVISRVQKNKEKAEDPTG